MRGIVDIVRRPTVRLTIRGPFGHDVVDAFIDTGFNGFLSLPPMLVRRLGLRAYGTTPTRVADGRMANRITYEGAVEWVGGPRNCQVVESPLPDCLIGT